MHNNCVTSVTAWVVYLSIVTPSNHGKDVYIKYKSSEQKDYTYMHIDTCTYMLLCNALDPCTHTTISYDQVLYNTTLLFPIIHTYMHHHSVYLCCKMNAKILVGGVDYS